MPKFSSSFKIAGRAVGNDAPVLFIAEAGVAHFGDSGKACALIDLAADAGADVFKTQAFNTEALVASTLPEWQERLKTRMKTWSEQSGPSEPASRPVSFESATRRGILYPLCIRGREYRARDPKNRVGRHRAPGRQVQDDARCPPARPCVRGWRR